MALTVTELGTPDLCSVGTIEIAPGKQEVLVWKPSDHVWIGRTKQSGAMVEPVGMQQQSSPATFQYSGLPAFTSSLARNNATDPKIINSSAGFGHQILDVPDLLAYYQAELVVQELLAAYLRPTDGNAAQMALWWVSMNPGDEFLSPPPDNMGLVLTSEAALSPNGLSNFYSTGWQLSPAASPAKSNSYTELYEKGSAGYTWHGFTGLWRLVGGPGAAGTGHADDLSKLPPVRDQLFAWHDADVVPRADNAQIEQWNNLWNRGEHMAQPTTINRPTKVPNVLNGHAVIRFAGNHWMTAVAPFFNMGQPYTTMVVLKQFSGGGAQQVWLAGSGQPPLFYRDTGTDKVNLWLQGTDITYNRGTAWPSPYMCMTAVGNGATSKIYEGTVQKVIGNAGGSGWTGLTVGAENGGALPSIIDVATIIRWGKELSVGEITTMYNWLKAKYPSMA